MSVYVHRIVLDANVINGRGNLTAMNEIESMFRMGLVELLKSNVLDKEFESFRLGFEKARQYENIGGLNLAGHIPKGHFFFTGGRRKSLFAEIYKTLWGDFWKKGGSEKDQRNSLRDVLHMDAAWMTGADIFITSEGALLAKQKDLEKLGFDVRLVTPEDCLNYLHEVFRNNYDSNDVSAIAARLRRSPPILLGSNSCFEFCCKDRAIDEVLFQTEWRANRLYITGNLRDSKGQKCVTLSPEADPKIHNASTTVSCSNSSPFLHVMVSNSGATASSQYLRVGAVATSSFRVAAEDEELCWGHLLPSGHLSLQGTFYDSKGFPVVRITRNELTIFDLEAVNLTRSMPN